MCVGGGVTGCTDKREDRCRQKGAAAYKTPTLLPGAPSSSTHTHTHTCMRETLKSAKRLLRMTMYRLHSRGLPLNLLSA